MKFKNFALIAGIKDYFLRLALLMLDSSSEDGKKIFSLFPEMLTETLGTITQPLINQIVECSKSEAVQLLDGFLQREKIPHQKIYWRYVEKVAKDLATGNDLPGIFSEPHGYFKDHTEKKEWKTVYGVGDGIGTTIWCIPAELMPREEF